MYLQAQGLNHLCNIRVFNDRFRDSSSLKDDTELFKQFMDNESFKRWMTDTVFGLTYDQPQA